MWREKLKRVDLKLGATRVDSDKVKTLKKETSSTCALWEVTQLKKGHAWDVLESYTIVVPTLHIEQHTLAY